MRDIMAKLMIITFVLALLIVPAACSESISGTTVSISMLDRNIETGEEFDLDVRIETDAPCRGVQCALSFDPALMRCDGVAGGGFLEDWAADNGGSTISYPQPTIDNDQGFVSEMGVVVVGAAEAGGAKGSGVLCSYHFTALADGTAEPTLSEVVVVDASGNAIPEVEINN